MELSEHFPFDMSGYRFASMVSLYSEEWQRVLEGGRRETGSPEWDALVAHGSRDMRVAESVKDVKPLEHRNQRWLETVQNMSNVTIENGKVTRPVDDYIVDLSKGDMWHALEIAHGIVHKEGEPSDQALIAAVAKVCFELKFGEANGNVMVVASDRFRDPVMSIEAYPGVLEPDKVDTIVLCSVFVEPVPHSFADGRSTWLESSRWACLPSMVAFCGFIKVDELSKSYVMRRGNRVVYLKHVMDFESMDKFQVAGSPESLDGLVERFEKSCPVFPCRECLCMNVRGAGSVLKPIARRGEEVSEREMKEYEDSMGKLMEMLEEANGCFYRNKYGPGKSRAMLRERKKRSKEQETRRKKLAALEKRRKSAISRGDSVTAMDLSMKLDGLVGDS